MDAQARINYDPMNSMNENQCQDYIGSERQSGLVELVETQHENKGRYQGRRS